MVQQVAQLLPGSRSIFSATIQDAAEPAWREQDSARSFNTEAARYRSICTWRKQRRGCGRRRCCGCVVAVVVVVVVEGMAGGQKALRLLSSLVAECAAAPNKHADQQTVRQFGSVWRKECQEVLERHASFPFFLWWPFSSAAPSTVVCFAMPLFVPVVNLKQ